MLPEDVVKRTVLDATTQLYMEVENDNGMNQGSITRVAAQDYGTSDNMRPSNHASNLTGHSATHTDLVAKSPIAH
jgi:hypothetical protein